MPKPFSAAFTHHLRFYGAAVCGVAAFLAARLAGFSAPALAGGDVFYLVFLFFCAVMISGQSADTLRARANSEDEGVGIVILITLATLAFFSDAVFVALNHRHDHAIIVLVLAGLGAFLGWLVLHTVMAFHYANLHYFDDPERPSDDGGDLDFPGCEEPNLWDFLYFSFVVGMTAQVSDVEVKTSVMRRAVLGHGVISFFLNTVFIAMAVNAAVALAA
jgi:uncharacterized membrane protein